MFDFLFYFLRRGAQLAPHLRGASHSGRVSVRILVFDGTQDARLWSLGFSLQGRSLCDAYGPELLRLKTPILNKVSVFLF